MRRIVQRMMPDGAVQYYWPFHVSMEGLETAVLCRDDDDYDAMVKIICVAAKRKNVIVIIYAVVSNHCHVAILAASQSDADAFGVELKKVYSMWFSKKYGEKKILRCVDIKAIPLLNDWHVRNSLAYIPRNALDNGYNVNEYKWSGYRAMFGADKNDKLVSVATLSKRETLDFMHTGLNLHDVPWFLDREWHLVPSSFCDYSYLEQAFENDQSFYLKVIGGLDSAETKYRLVDAPRIMKSDGEFYRSVQDVCLRWFQKDLSTLSEEKKVRVIGYVSHIMKTTVPQLSRVFGIPREKVGKILKSQ